MKLIRGNTGEGKLKSLQICKSNPHGPPTAGSWGKRTVTPFKRTVTPFRWIRRNGTGGARRSESQHSNWTVVAMKPPDFIGARRPRPARVVDARTCHSVAAAFGRVGRHGVVRNDWSGFCSGSLFMHAGIFGRVAACVFRWEELEGVKGAISHPYVRLPISEQQHAKAMNSSQLTVAWAVARVAGRVAASWQVVEARGAVVEVAGGEGREVVRAGEDAEAWGGGRAVAVAEESGVTVEVANVGGMAAEVWEISGAAEVDEGAALVALVWEGGGGEAARMVALVAWVGGVEVGGVAWADVEEERMGDAAARGLEVEVVLATGVVIEALGTVAGMVKGSAR